MMDKHGLRKSMLSQRMNLTEAERARQNAEISNRLLCDEAYMHCKTLFIYVSVGNEIATEAIINDALKKNKVVCVPKCREKGIMEAFRIHAFQDLSETKYGIPEPPLTCVKIAPENIDLCVIPALCCDLDGYRLGYGAGYYDRFLPGTNAVKIALCAEERVISRLPAQEHDIKCDKIITESEVYNCI